MFVLTTYLSSLADQIHSQINKNIHDYFYNFMWPRHGRRKQSTNPGKSANASMQRSEDQRNANIYIQPLCANQASTGGRLLYLKDQKNGPCVTRQHTITHRIFDNKICLRTNATHNIYFSLPIMRLSSRIATICGDPSFNLCSTQGYIHFRRRTLYSGKHRITSMVNITFVWELETKERPVDTSYDVRAVPLWLKSQSLRRMILFMR